MQSGKVKLKIVQISCSFIEQKMQSMKVLRYYQKLLHNRPYAVQTIQTVSLMAAGDVVCQTLIEKKSFNEINFYRTAKFGSVGLLLGPALVSWYRFLEKLNYTSSRFVIIKKIAVDQLIFAPIAIGSVTTAVSLLDGKNTEEIKEKLETDFSSILMTSYKVWPFVQYVNFSFVPLNYRVLVTQCVGLVWNTYLAWKLNSNKT